MLHCDCRSLFVIHLNCACACGDSNTAALGASRHGSCSVHFGVRRSNGLLCLFSQVVGNDPGGKRTCRVTGVDFTRCMGASFSCTGGFVVSSHGTLIFRIKMKITIPCKGSGDLPFRGLCFSKNTGDIHK